MAGGRLGLAIGARPLPQVRLTPMIRTTIIPRRLAIARDAGEQIGEIVRNHARSTSEGREVPGSVQVRTETPGMLGHPAGVP